MEGRAKPVCQQVSPEPSGSQPVGTEAYQACVTCENPQGLVIGGKDAIFERDSAMQLESGKPQRCPENAKRSPLCSLFPPCTYLKSLFLPNPFPHLSQTFSPPHASSPQMSPFLNSCLSAPSHRGKTGGHRSFVMDSKIPGRGKFLLSPLSQEPQALLGNPYPMCIWVSCVNSCFPFIGAFCLLC